MLTRSIVFLSGSRTPHLLLTSGDRRPRRLRDRRRVAAVAVHPMARTRWRELYRNADGDGGLAWEPSNDEATLRYPARFATAPVDAPLELTGPVALRLWISSDREDLDVLVRLQHLDVDGEPIPAIGPQGGPMPMAIGWLRASHRELDPARSEPYRPWHTHLKSAAAPARRTDAARGGDLADEHQPRTGGAAFAGAGQRRRRPGEPRP